MNVLNRLTIKNLKLNRKRTIVTIVGIVLATALLVAVTTIATSMRALLSDRSRKMETFILCCMRYRMIRSVE